MNIIGIKRKGLNLDSFKREEVQELEKGLQEVYVDNYLNKKLGRVGMPYKKGEGSGGEQGENFQHENSQDQGNIMNIEGKTSKRFQKELDVVSKHINKELGELNYTDGISAEVDRKGVLHLTPNFKSGRDVDYNDAADEWALVKDVVKSWDGTNLKTGEKEKLPNQYQRGPISMNFPRNVILTKDQKKILSEFQKEAKKLGIKSKNDLSFSVNDRGELNFDSNSEGAEDDFEERDREMLTEKWEDIKDKFGNLNIEEEDEEEAYFNDLAESRNKKHEEETKPKKRVQTPPGWTRQGWKEYREYRAKKAAAAQKK